MTNIDWRKYIHSDPEVLLGKPVVKGTRMSVEFILGFLPRDGQNYRSWKTIQR